MAYTRAELRALIRQRLGWPAADTFVTDAELNSYIQDSTKELHSLLSVVHRAGEWGLSVYPLTTVAGTASYVLPTTFGRMVRVTMLYSSQWISLDRLDLTVEPIDLRRQSFNPGSARWYLQSGLVFGGVHAINFSPTPDAAYDIQVWHMLAAPTFAADGDTSWLGEDEYLILDGMLKCRVKEEADVRDIMAQKQLYRQRIEADATPIDLGQAQYVQDAREHFNTVDAQRDFWRRYP